MLSFTPFIAGSFVLKTITVDGGANGFDEWNQVLADPTNVCFDRTATDDPDVPGANRDIKRFAYTWDNTNFYIYYKRMSAGNNAVTFFAYMDRDNDGLLESTDYVLALKFNGVAFQNNGSQLTTYVPLNPAGDPIVGDGQAQPGRPGTGSGSPVVIESAGAGSSILGAGGGYNNLELEGKVSWAALGLAPGTPMRFKASAGTNPGTIEDNTGPSTSQFAGVELSPNNTGSAPDGTVKTYTHTVRNTGNTSDTLNLSAFSALGWTAGVYDAAGVNPLSSVTLASGASTTVTVKVTIPSGAAKGLVDETTIKAASQFNPSVFKTAVDRTVVGLFTILPRNSGSAAAGISIDYSHMVTNSTAQALTVDLAAVSSQGWTVSILDAAGVNPVSVLDMPAGTTADIKIRLAVPAGAALGTVDVVRLTGTAREDAAYSDTATDATTVRPRVTVNPDSDLSGGSGSTIVHRHTVTNSWNTADTINLTGTSSNGWSVTFYDATMSSPITSVALGPNGDSKEIVALITVPYTAATGTVDTLTVRGTSAANPAEQDTATDITRIVGLNTYKDPGFTSPSTIFKKGGTAYGQGYNIALTDVVFRWLNPSGTPMVTSAPIGVASGQAEHLFSIGTTDTVGLWTLELRNSTTNALITSSNFTVTYNAFIESLFASDATSPNNIVYVQSRLSNPGASSITNSTVNYVIWWDINGDDVFNPGDRYIDSGGNAQTYGGSGTVTTHLTSGVSVAPGGTWSEPGNGWTISTENFPYKANFRVTATWKEGSLFIDEKTDASTTRVQLAVSPVTTISAPPPDGPDSWYVTEPTITLTKDLPGTTYYSWDSPSGPWTAYSAGIAPPQGQHTLYYYSVDNAGNTEALKSQVFKADTSGPTGLGLISPADGASVNTVNPVLGWSAASDSASGLASYELYIDGSLNKTLGASETTATPNAPLTEGSHTWYVKAIDNAGNSTTSSTYTLTVDAGPPTTALSTSPAAPDGIDGWFVTSPTITLTASEPGSTYYSWTSSSGPWTAYSAPIAAPEGQNTLYYYSVDTAGNDETVKSEPLKVDTADPATSLTTDPAAPDGANGWFSTMPSVTLSGEAGATVYYQWDGTGGAWTTYAAPFNGLEGDHTLYYYSVDQAGNAEAHNSRQIKVDTGSPSSTITVPANGATLTGSAYTVTGTADNGASGVSLVEISINGGAWQAATGTASWTYSWTLPADGSYTIRSRATDGSGSQETPGPGVTVTVDNSDPVTTLTNDPATPDGANGWYVTIPTATLSVSEPATTYYQWDSTSGAWTTYGGAFSVPSGAHTLYYYSVDSIGNTEPTQNHEFKVDSADPTDPSLSSSSHTVGVGSSDPTVDIGWSGASDGESGVDGFSVSWDNSPTGIPDAVKDFEETDSSATSPSLADGTWYAHLRTVDNAGRWTSTTHLGSFVIDTTTPTTTLTTSPAAPDGTNGFFITAPSVTLTADEPGTTYYQWDGTGGSWSTYSGPFTAPEGTHTLYFYSSDTSGNEETVKSQMIKTDTSDPSTTVTLSPATPDGDNGFYIASPTVTLATEPGATTYYRFDSGAWTVYSAPFVAPEGTHTLSVYSVDEAGNAEAPQSQTIKVDT
ncbi:MAG: OmpL47-type beta-barrel domain-containing protein, partial [Candidatus Aquicultorales bacterium]